MADFINVIETPSIQVIGMPPFSVTDFSWLKEYVKGDILTFEANDLLGAGGFVANMKSIKITFVDNSVQNFIFKAIGAEKSTMAKHLGTPREAFFYHVLAPTLRDAGVVIPAMLYAHGDMSTGIKNIVLEDVSQDSMQSGYLFGPGSPHNWGKDLEAIIAKSNVTNETVSMKDVALKTFIMAAKMHATYWKKPDLLKYEWLRASDWFQATEGGLKTFTASQDSASKAWAAARAKAAAGESKINWNPHLVACLDASFGKISWEVYQADIKTRAWTLMHGDLHPANIMWRWARHEPVLLDWEAVGIGSGPQDLAQYMISHASPADRRQYEEELVREYYACLTGSAPQYWADHPSASVKTVDSSVYTWEMCWADYVSGGTERWVWLFGILLSMCPDSMNQYFHDQVAAFIEDHGVTPENIGMPRV